MKHKTVILFNITLLALVFNGEPSDKTTVSVYTLKPIGISQDLAESLQEHLESNVLKYNDQYEVLTRNDMDKILAENRYLQSGLCLDEACLIEAGQILGVEKIITGTVSKVGHTYNIVLKLIDVRHGKLESSVNRQYCGTVDSLLSVIETASGKLLKIEKTDTLKEPDSKADKNIELTQQNSLKDNNPINLTEPLSRKEENISEKPIQCAPDNSAISRQGKVIGISAVSVLVGVATILLANSLK